MNDIERSIAIKDSTRIHQSLTEVFNLITFPPRDSDYLTYLTGVLSIIFSYIFDDLLIREYIRWEDLPNPITLKNNQFQYLFNNYLSRDFLIDYFSRNKMSLRTFIILMEDSLKREFFSSIKALEILESYIIATCLRLPYDFQPNDIRNKSRTLREISFYVSELLRRIPE